MLTVIFLYDIILIKHIMTNVTNTYVSKLIEREGSYV